MAGTGPKEFDEYLCPVCGSDRLLLGKYNGRCIACRAGFKTRNANALVCGECGVEAGACTCNTTAGQISRLSDGFFVNAINRADELIAQTEKMIEENKP
ncbi:MAG: hypothetical protein PHC68_09170 [Syntrophorhabdaceae bacterium]|nr:hypothetical protein [Syntrophorhabdaceae bacterium]